MNTISKLLVATALAAAFSSCKKITGDGPVVTENRNADNFSAVTSAISADVHYTQSSNYQVKISAQQNILNVLETYTTGNELVIKFKNGVSIGSHERINVDVSSPEINSLRISGSGNIVAADSITSTDLNLMVSGSGNISLHSLSANSLTAKISGSGNITISGGELQKENLTISGSGDINTINVPTKTITTATSGSGKMSVQALEKLDVTISGSGSVFYMGTPEIKAKISGSGKLIKQ